MGHLVMENRSGLVVDTRLAHLTGTAEREAAADMLGELPAGGRVTVGPDKLFDTQDFVAEMRRLGVTPHVAQHTNGRRSAVDGRTTRHAGYAVSLRSLRTRKRIEEGFGWMKTVGGLRKTRHRGTARVGWQPAPTRAAEEGQTKTPSAKCRLVPQPARMPARPSCFSPLQLVDQIDGVVEANALALVEAATPKAIATRVPGAGAANQDQICARS